MDLARLRAQAETSPAPCRRWWRRRRREARDGLGAAFPRASPSWRSRSPRCPLKPRPPQSTAASPSRPRAGPARPAWSSTRCGGVPRRARSPTRSSLTCPHAGHCASTRRARLRARIRRGGRRVRAARAVTAAAHAAVGGLQPRARGPARVLADGGIALGTTLERVVDGVARWPTRSCPCDRDARVVQRGDRANAEPREHRDGARAAARAGRPAAGGWGCAVSTIEDAFWFVVGNTMRAGLRHRRVDSTTRRWSRDAPRSD